MENTLKILRELLNSTLKAHEDHSINTDSNSKKINNEEALEYYLEQFKEEIKTMVEFRTQFDKKGFFLVDEIAKNPKLLDSVDQIKIILNRLNEFELGVLIGDILEEILLSKDINIEQYFPKTGLYDPVNTYGYFIDSSEDPKEYFKSAEYRGEIKSMLSTVYATYRESEKRENLFNLIFSDLMDEQKQFFGDQGAADDIIDNNLNQKKIETYLNIRLIDRGLEPVSSEDVDDYLREVVGTMIVARDKTKLSDLYKVFNLDFKKSLSENLMMIDGEKLSNDGKQKIKPQKI